jgi:Domain of unknown function (DUF4193)
MMGASPTRRQTRLLHSDRGASQSVSREYDDNGLRIEVPLEEILPGQDLARGWADIDGADGFNMERTVVLPDGDLVGDDISMPVIAKRANEFTCSSCFLIHHVSRLATSNGGQLICTDCA